jgi:purine-binding chemotaxis protein CheW
VTHLIFTVNDWTCGVRLPYVAEITRPLPTTPIANSPAYVLGVTKLRGSPVPVVDAGALLQGRPTRPQRFVRLLGESRQLALAVSSVEGVESLRPTGDAVPPLLAPELAWVEALGNRDEQLFAVLSSIRLLREHGQDAEP